MHKPIPPFVLISELEQDEQRKVIRLALLVAADLAVGRDWAAYEKIEFANLTVEQKLGFWSLLDSEQRTAIKSMAEAAK